ncbi:MAG: ferredoxin [Hyphomicrobiales bacterium]|nr:ferredoxin [Hyphomicrobiales bacterium]
MAKHVVAPVGELPPGSRKLVEIGARRIVVFNTGGEFFALSDRCPHEGGSLFHGKVMGLVESSEPGEYRYTRAGEMVKCPWHGWEFDLRTGRSQCDPRLRVRSYATGVVHGCDLAKDVPAAETFPVRVEDDYVVVEA